MILVELFSKDDCHLCDIVKETLLRVRRTHPFDLRLITIQQGDEYFESMKERIPVVHINHEFAFQHRVPEKELVAKLRQLVSGGSTNNRP